MKVPRKTVLFSILFILTGFNWGFAQEKGEILISPKSDYQPSEQVKKETEKKQVQVLEKPKDQQAEDFEKLKNYKRKIYIIYIVLFICLLYLLISYRSRKRRL